MSGEKGSRCESCTNSSPYFASRGMIHWETGKETDALESNPEAMSRETCFRSTGTLRSCHEELAVQNRKADICPTAGEMVFFVMKILEAPR